MYNTLQFIHVLAAIVAVGTNVTYFFWLRQARKGTPDDAFALTGIQALDRKVSNPAYVVLPVTGIVMVLTGDLGFSTFWIATAIGLFVVMGAFAGIAFSPSLRKQIELAQAGESGATYAAAAKRTTVTGTITMLLVAAIVFLMVVKPAGLA